MTSNERFNDVLLIPESVTNADRAEMARILGPGSTLHINGEETGYPSGRSPKDVADDYGDIDETKRAEQASKAACRATFLTEHTGAVSRSLEAMRAVIAGHAQDAADMHRKTAGVHETASIRSRKDGNRDGAELHDRAASLHRIAASHHDALSTNRSIMTNSERFADILPVPRLQFRTGKEPIINMGEQTPNFDGREGTSQVGGSGRYPAGWNPSGDGPGDVFPKRQLTPQEMLEEAGIGDWERGLSEGTPDEETDDGQEPELDLIDRTGEKRRTIKRRSGKGSATRDVTGHPQPDEDLSSQAGYAGRDAETEALERDRENYRRLKVNRGMQLPRLEML